MASASASPSSARSRRPTADVSKRSARAWDAAPGSCCGCRRHSRRGRAEPAVTRPPPCCDPARWRHRARGGRRPRRAREGAARALAERGAYVATATMPPARSTSSARATSTSSSPTSPCPTSTATGCSGEMHERELATGRTIPAIAVTAHTSIEDEARALRRHVHSQAASLRRAGSPRPRAACSRCAARPLANDLTNPSIDH